MKEFVTEKEWKNGEFNCKIIFTQLGHRCGYVGVPKGHPMFGRDYNKCIEDIDCYGGLTYSGFRDDNSKEYIKVEIKEQKLYDELFAKVKISKGDKTTFAELFKQN